MTAAIPSGPRPTVTATMQAAPGRVRFAHDVKLDDGGEPVARIAKKITSPASAALSSVSPVASQAGSGGASPLASQHKVTRLSHKITNALDSIFELICRPATAAKNAVVSHFGSDDYINSTLGMQKDLMILLGAMSAVCVAAALVSLVVFPILALPFGLAAFVFFHAIGQVAAGFMDMDKEEKDRKIAESRDKETKRANDLKERELDGKKAEENKRAKDIDPNAEITPIDVAGEALRRENERRRHERTLQFEEDLAKQSAASKASAARDSSAK